MGLLLGLGGRAESFQISVNVDLVVLQQENPVRSYTLSGRTRSGYIAK
jgi:hypothetical protein